MGLKEFVVAFNTVNLSNEDAVQLARNIHKEIKSEKINTEDKKIYSLLVVCLKATNTHLKHPEESIISLGQACISTLAAIEDKELGKQLCLLRYNFIRKLITCKQFGSAHCEAMSLSRLLCTKHSPQRFSSSSSSSPPLPPPSEDDIKLLIGVLLTLLICETEPSNQQTSPQQLDTILQFVDVVHPFLQAGALSSTKETLQHCTSLSTYLYKIAMSIRQSKNGNCNQLESIIARMVLLARSSSGSGSVELLERVISWVSKLATRCPLPDIASQIMSNGLYKATDGLSDTAALLIVDAMCEFVSKTIQHQQDMLIAKPAVAVRMIDNLRLSCHVDDNKTKRMHRHHHHHHPVLRQTVLLIPALVPFTLAISSNSIETEGGKWVAAVELAMQQQQQQQETGACTSSSSSRCIRAAAEKCINVVRRVATGKLGHPSHQTLFIDAFSHDCQQANAVASALEVLCNHNDDDSEQSASTNHTGIVAFAIATKLRASAALYQAEKHHNNSNKRDTKASSSSLQLDGQLHIRLASSLKSLLGWSFPFLLATDNKVAAVSSKEVAWLSASLFNIGVDCIAANQLSLAIPPLQAAATCSLELLKLAPISDSNDDESAAVLKDAVKRVMAVIDTQRKAGNDDGAIDTCIAAASYLLAFSNRQGNNTDDMVDNVLKEVGGLIISTASSQQEAGMVARRIIDDYGDGVGGDGRCAINKAKLLMIFYSLGLNIRKDESIGMLVEASWLAAKGGNPYLQAEIEAMSIINKFESLAKQYLSQAKQLRQERATQAAKEAAGASHPPPEPQPLDGGLSLPDLKVWTPLHEECVNVAQKLHQLLLVCETDEDASKARARLKALSNDVAALLSSSAFGSAPGDAVLPSLEQRMFGSWHTRDLPSCVVDNKTARESMEEAVASAQKGRMVTALVSASEAHKSLSQALQQQSADAPASSSSSTSSPSWWQLSMDYLECLILLGRLFEHTGLPDEALQALKEGQRLASSMGNSLISAQCCAYIAAILYKQDLKEAAAMAVDAAEELLELEVGSTTTRILVVKRCLRLELDAHQALVLFDSTSRHKTKEALALAQNVVQQIVTVLEELDEYETATTTSGMVAQLLSSSCKCHTVLVHAALLLLEPKKKMLSADAKQQLIDSLDVYQNRSSVCWPETVVQALLLKSQLLLLDDENSRDAATKHLTVWGVGGKGGTVHDGDDSAAAISQGWSMLWKALSLSRELPVLFKQAAQQLAFYCGRRGYCHLAAVLLHSACLGATMRLQHKFVLAAKKQKMDRKGEGIKKEEKEVGGSTSLAEAMLNLDGLDWQHSIQELLGGGDNSSSSVDNDEKEEEVVKLLDDQAKDLLSTWLGQLPGNITVTSVNTSPNNNAIIISKLAPHSPPIIITLPVSIYTSSSSLISQFGNSLRLDNHPTKALNMTTMIMSSAAAGDQNNVDEDGSGRESLGSPSSSSSPSSSRSTSVSAVESVLEEFDRILTDSGDSMKNMSVETKEEQRAWWRRRMELDDALGCLVQFVDDAWLGPWKCLLHGALVEKKGEGHDEGGSSSSSSSSNDFAGLDELLLQHLGCLNGSSCGGNGNEEVVRELISALLTYGSTHQMTDDELNRAAKDLCHVFRRSSSRDAIDCTADLLRRTIVAIIGRGSNDGGDDQYSGASCQSTPVKSASTARSLDKALQEMSLNDDDGVQQTPAVVMKTAPRKQKTDAVATTTARGTRNKTRSRLASMMKTTTTVRRTTAREATTRAVPQITVKREPRTTTTTAKQPLHRQRAAPDCASKFNLPQTAPPPQAGATSTTTSSTMTNHQYHPMILVLDGALQCLPWEASVGLKGQHVHRVPSLPSAAAAAAAVSTCSSSSSSADDDNNPSSPSPSSMMLDLSCTYYALNPSGDLITTQATFEPWFSTITGWQGRSGQAPSLTELTTALETRSFFIYLGHGGGEQYLPPSRLRALNKCAASLLMGCSSGRLGHKGKWYEPSGVVLAYMLGGCPSAVANLWDVTDRDIDRFSEALLTSWMSGGGGNEERKRGVAAAVNESRDACKLKLLVGAAPVCYGLPAAVLFSKER